MKILKKSIFYFLEKVTTKEQYQKILYLYSKHKQNKMFRKIDQVFLSTFSNIPLKSNKKETIFYLTQKLQEMNKLKEKNTIISDVNYFEWIKNRIS